MIATNDPISDMLTRIRNAGAVQKRSVSLPHSNVKESVAKLLANKGFIDKVNVIAPKDGVGKTLELTLFGANSNFRITEIARISKPGRRFYAGFQEIPVIKRGRGIVIVSTSKGMMTGDDAKAQKLGGELICRVY
jgi:small subunit ribosomal protein S8